MTAAVPGLQNELNATPRLTPQSTVLVTGAAGFIGSHLSERLAKAGHDVVGVDCFTEYYARSLKEANLEQLRDTPNFRLLELDLSIDDLGGLLEGVDVVFHLAAQAGVRGSFGEGFENYLRHNIGATQRLLEVAKAHPLRAFVYSSSSSVYGNPAQLPMSEQTPLCPVSPYGMTKLATEALAATYHRCFGVPVVGLRYFTAYGPRQRPDMAFTRFMRAILDDEPLRVLGDGSQVRDFTYVDDIVDGTIAAARRGRFGALYNIGGGRSVQLLAAIRAIERAAGRPARLEIVAPQRGDAYRTGCDCELAFRELGYAPRTVLEDGIAAQLEWVVRSRRGDALAEWA